MNDAKLKILFLSIEYPPETGGGGIGSYVACITPALVKRGHEVHILSYVLGQSDRNYIVEGVYIHRRGEMKPLWLRYILRYFVRFATIDRICTGFLNLIEYHRLGINFDVIEYPDWKAEGLFFTLLHKKPLVAHLHTPLSLIAKYDGIRMGPDCIIASFLEQFALSRADVILSPSLLLIKELKLCNRDKTVIIPHAIDVLNDLQSVFYTEPVILFLAHIQRLKAPEVLIEAFRIIKKCIPQAKILFVGNNTTSYYFEHIKELTDSIDGCEFLGYIPRDKLLPIFSRIRVLAMPSRFENFPMAAIETMAAGRPVVVTSMSGIAELINQKGGGIVVPPSNPKALSQALIPFLLDVSYADRIGIQAKMIVKNQLNPDIIVLQKERVYNQAISNFVRGSNNKK